jgi:hypothetical protein
MRTGSATLVVLLAATLAASCNTSNGAPGTCALLPGDLVITEIMPDPDGADGGNEWFELYNSTTQEVSLAGLSLELVTGRGSKVHVVRGNPPPTILARGYLALGDGIAGLNNLGYSYGTGLGSLPNEGGTIVVRCGDAEIDRVQYGVDAAGPPEPSAGKALQLTGTQTPEYHVNDVPESWCDAAEPMDDGTNLGTPGAPNTPCPGSGCDDGAGGFRPVRAPQPGELVISEIMSNSPGTEDHDLEWFEVHNPTGEAIDLLGLEVLYGATCQSATMITGAGCLTVPAGGHAVVAGNADAAANGGVTAVATFGGSGLVNDNGCLALRIKATEVEIDRATYGKSTDGASFSLDPASLDAAANDDQAAWCPGTTAYGAAGGLGTPGAANPGCQSAGCDDGAGGTRAPRVPQPGELVISEIMSNSPGTEDHAQEWIEVHNPTGAAVDLLGVEVLYGSTCGSATALVGAGCLTVPAGGYVVLAGSADAAANGGVAPLATFGGSGLRNDAGCVALRVQDTQVEVDRATYGVSVDGRAFSLDPGRLDAAANDDQAAWCAATASYGSAGGYGTPGAANPACQAAGCDDGAGGTRAPRAPKVGELVLSEIMSNSPGTEDHAKEWIEVYNPTSDVIDLLGVEVLYGATCGSATALVGAGCVTVPAGGYAVLAGSADPAANGGVTALGTFGGSGLRNDAGCVALRVKETQQIVDQATYGTSTDGHAFALDPSKLDATLNDDQATWCLAGTAYGTAGGYGTPGAANPACQAAGCDDGAGGTRPPRVPAAGELVITEVFSNTPGSEAHAQEWIEVHNPTGQAVDLAGVEVLYGSTCQSTSALVGSGCVTVPAGGYAVLAGSAAAALNGGVTPLATFGGTGLRNDAGCVALRVKETLVVVDQATYGTSTDGRAFALDPSKLDATLNDDQAAWCLATTTFGTAGGYGTPGAANPACVVTGGCDDGAGGTRPQRVPQPGELVISEIMSNSPGTEDHAKEWIEVYNATAEAIDLLGVQVLVGATCQTAASLVGAGCVTVPPAAYVVLAGSVDPAVNGGVTALASFGGSGVLNDGGCVALRVTASGVEVDRATYGTSTDGHAFSLDPGKLSATDNDVGANWCIAALAYGTAGGYGTPGAANPACGVSMCNDGGTARAVVAPADGTVFVTEVFSDPTGTDAGKEWFEVYVTQPADLNGMVVTHDNGTSKRVWTLASPDCMRATAGTYVVIAASTDPATNGGLPTADIYAVPNLSLFNTAGTIVLEAGGHHVDTASFPLAPTGKSVSLSPAQLTAAGNDAAASFCTATTTTVFTGTGTPGQANDPCT